MPVAGFFCLWCPLVLVTTKYLPDLLLVSLAGLEDAAWGESGHRLHIDSLVQVGCLAVQDLAVSSSLQDTLDQPFHGQWEMIQWLRSPASQHACSNILLGILNSSNEVSLPDLCRAID